jgi:hypothetical protein
LIESHFGAVVDACLRAGDGPHVRLHGIGTRRPGEFGVTFNFSEREGLIERHEKRFRIVGLCSPA